MSAREIGIMAPLVVLTILLGFYPKPVIDTTAGAVNAMIQPYKDLIEARHAMTVPPVLAQLQNKASADAQ